MKLFVAIVEGLWKMAIAACIIFVVLTAFNRIKSDEDNIRDLKARVSVLEGKSK